MYGRGGRSLHLVAEILCVAFASFFFFCEVDVVLRVCYESEAGVVS